MVLLSLSVTLMIGCARPLMMEGLTWSACGAESKDLSQSRNERDHLISSVDKGGSLELGSTGFNDDDALGRVGSCATLCCCRRCKQ